MKLMQMFAALLCVMCITQAAWAGRWTPIWFQVCHIMDVDPKKIPEPKVTWVDRVDPRVKGCWAVYYPFWNEICTTTFAVHIIAHEFSHAVMSSPEYQEPKALDMEKYFQ